MVSLTFLPTGSADADAAAIYENQLSNLAMDFGFEAGERPHFDEAKFNKLMGRSRIAVKKSVKRAGRDHLGTSAYWLARSISISDRATGVAIAANMSGAGYSDDLASYGAFISQRLFVGLGEEQADEIPDWAMMYLLQLHDTALARYGDEDWSTASRYWAHGVAVIEWLSN